MKWRMRRTIWPSTAWFITRWRGRFPPRTTCCTGRSWTPSIRTRPTRWSRAAIRMWFRTLPTRIFSPFTRDTTILPTAISTSTGIWTWRSGSIILIKSICQSTRRFRWILRRRQSRPLRRACLWRRNTRSWRASRRRATRIFPTTSLWEKVWTARWALASRRLRTRW